MEAVLAGIAKVAGVFKMHLREFMRTACMVLFVVSSGLVAAGRGNCVPIQDFPGTEKKLVHCYLNRFILDANYWSKWPSSKLYGQFFVIIASFVSFWLCVATLIMRVFSVSRRTEIIMVVIGLVVSLICAILECWYASGFGELGDNLAAENANSAVVKTWIAAAFFYFLISFLFICDIYFSWKLEQKKENEDTASMWSATGVIHDHRP